MHFLTNHSDQAAPAMRQPKQIEGWGRIQRTFSSVWYPQSVDDIREVLSLARSDHYTVASYGAGHSYTDAALNTAGVTINLSRMKRLLAWNPEHGIIRVEPGFTIGDLWRMTITDGWWPIVVPSTMEATLGGCLSMNVHGKNAWRWGPIGEHVLALELLLASGELVTVTPTDNPDLFYAAIGGLGILGIITGITLQLWQIKSGQLLTRQRPASSLADMFAIFAEEAQRADYLEAWVDGHANGRCLGRGSVECAYFIDEPDSVSLQPETHVLQDMTRIVAPIIALEWAMRPLFNTCVRLSNGILYQQRVSRGSEDMQCVSLGRFHFHSVSEYRVMHALTPTGIASIEPLVPAEQAHAVFTELLQRSQRARLAPIWCMLKQHRADPFLLSYHVDGFSLELSYRVTPHNASKLRVLLREMLEPIIAAGGRLYLAKDSVLNAETFARSMGGERVERFLALKQTYDPEWLFQSDLFRRILVGNA